MTVIDEYLKKIDPEKRKHLERIREIARKVVPDAGEKIGYGMPTMTYKGKPFLGYNIHKNHIGIYPYGAEEITVFQNRLSGLGYSSGAIRVPFDHPIDEKLLTDIISHRIKRI